MILSLIYSLFLYNRIFFGLLQEYFIRYYCDCSRLEFVLAFIFMFCIIVGGLFPNIILNYCIDNLIISQINI
jgi:NADH:ubiquinone oxidoreductase subunit 4 (subunit M)